MVLDAHVKLVSAAFKESNARPTQPHVGTTAILRMRLIPIPRYGTKQKRLE